MGRLQKSLHLIRRGLPYFLAAFFLFLCIGFLTGWGEREENARDAIYAGIEYGVRDDGQPALQFTCDADGMRYDYLVDSNTLVRNSAVLESRIAGNPSEQNQALRTAALAFFGGPMGAVSYKTAWEAIGQARKRPLWLQATRIVASILGGISGYALGYWQGSHWRIDCDHDMGRFVLADEAAWRVREEYYFHLMAWELVAGESARPTTGGARNTNPLDDGPFVICKTPGSAILGGFETVSDPGAGEFRDLLSVAAAYEQATQSEAYRILDAFRTAHAIVQTGRLTEDAPLIREMGRETGLYYSEEAFNAACAQLSAGIGELLDAARAP